MLKGLTRVPSLTKHDLFSVSLPPEPSANQLPWPVLCSPVVGVLLLALGLFSSSSSSDASDWSMGPWAAPWVHSQAPDSASFRADRRLPLGEDSIGLK